MAAKISIGLGVLSFLLNCLGSGSAWAALLWISRQSGAVQCKPKSGRALKSLEQELKLARIRVLHSRQGTDGKMHAQMCGMPSGQVYFFEIHSEDLPKAQARGYVEVKEKN